MIDRIALCFSYSDGGVLFLCLARIRIEQALNTSSYLRRSGFVFVFRDGGDWPNLPEFYTKRYRGNVFKIWLGQYIYVHYAGFATIVAKSTEEFVGRKYRDQG